MVKEYTSEDIAHVIAKAEDLLDAEIDAEVNATLNGKYLYLIEKRDKALYKAIKAGLKNGNIYIENNCGPYIPDKDNVLTSDVIVGGTFTHCFTAQDFTEKEWYLFKLIASTPELDSCNFTIIDYDSDAIAVYTTMYIIAVYKTKPEEVNGMKHREEIIKALDKADFRAIASDLIENAYPMVDQKGRPCGQMDGILVYDEIGKELEVLSESPSTWTPSFTYLYRLEGNEDYDAMNDDEREELEDNVWEGLSNMYWRIYNEENDE